MFTARDFIAREMPKPDNMIIQVNTLYDKCVEIASEQGVSMTTMGILLKTVGDLILMDENRKEGKYI